MDNSVHAFVHTEALLEIQKLRKTGELDPKGDPQVLHNDMTDHIIEKS